MNNISLMLGIVFVIMVATTMSIQLVLADSKGQCANCAANLSPGHLNKIDDNEIEQDISQHNAPGQVKVHCEPCSAKILAPGQIKKQID